MVHLATHGDFRPDNPLFSGLTLADGSLTALDKFNLLLADNTLGAGIINLRRMPLNNALVTAPSVP